jgi:hypothetical protein
VTVASLQDMGYVVDFSAADPFDVSKLDPSCVCTSVKEQEKKGGFKLGAGTMIILKQDDDEKKEQKGGFKLSGTTLTRNDEIRGGTFETNGAPGRTRVRGGGKVGGDGGRSIRRKLTDKGRQVAVDYGRLYLEEMRKKKESIVETDDKKFIGDRFVSVLYREEEEVYAVEVWGDTV